MEQISDKEIVETFKKFSKSQQADFILHNRNLFKFERNRFGGHIYARMKTDMSIQFDFTYSVLENLLNLDI